MSLDIYDGILPKGYCFPDDFLSAVNNDIDLLPWRFFANDNALDFQGRFDYLRECFPQGLLIPFAYIHDLTGFWRGGWPSIACFDPYGPNSVLIYHSEIDSSPWDNKPYETFADWLVMAKEESDIYKSEIAFLEASDNQID